MKILIIGGTGLISTGITRLLVERNEDVTIYNRGKTTAQVPEGVKRIFGDRKNYPAFEAQMRQKEPFDCVIDMVCFLPQDAESAIHAFGGQIKQYIFCSTVDVYTKPATHYPIKEDEQREPSKSNSYASNKAICEKILLEAHRHGDFSATIIRPAYTYGEGRGILHTFGLGTYFIDRVRRGKPIIVHGDGTSFWVACYRDDVARAFANAVGNPKTFGKTYHVTGEEWMTWNSYHQGVAEAMNVPLPALVHIPTDLLEKIAPKQAKGCVENFHFNDIFDNTSAKADLDFRYSISWIEGVRRTVRWLDEHGQIENSDNYPFYDRILAAWEHLGTKMASDLA